MKKIFRKAIGLVVISAVLIVLAQMGTQGQVSDGQVVHNKGPEIIKGATCELLLKFVDEATRRSSGSEGQPVFIIVGLSKSTDGELAHFAYEMLSTNFKDLGFENYVVAFDFQGQNKQSVRIFVGGTLRSELYPKEGVNRDLFSCIIGPDIEVPK